VRFDKAHAHIKRAALSLAPFQTINAFAKSILLCFNEHQHVGDSIKPVTLKHFPLPAVVCELTRA
jgi:hypothetical protein